MTTQPKTTEAENPYLTREDALAILNTATTEQMG